MVYKIRKWLQSPSKRHSYVTPGGAGQPPFRCNAGWSEPLYTALILESFFLPWAMFCVYGEMNEMPIQRIREWMKWNEMNEMEKICREQTSRHSENSKTFMTAWPHDCCAVLYRTVLYYTVLYCTIKNEKICRQTENRQSNKQVAGAGFEGPLWSAENYKNIYG